jgi:hypothetical protein
VLCLGHNTPLAVPSAFLRFLRAIFKLGKYPRRLAGLVPQQGRFLHLLPDDAAQSLVARQAEHKVHSIVFTPAQQFVAAKAGIAAQDNLHYWPRRSNLRHDTLYLLPAAERGVVVGFSQPRTQYLLAAKNIQREIAIVVIVAVEESPLLLAMQRQIGGIHVQHDLIRSAGVRFQEYLYQQFVHRLFPESDLLVPVRGARAQFHSV